MKHKNYLYTLSLLLLMSVLGGSCSAIQPEDQPIEITEPGLTVRSGIIEGKDTEFNLDNGARLIINAGGMEAGSSVSFRKIPEAEWDFEDQGNIYINALYEIEACGWNSGLESTIILPIEESNIEVSKKQAYDLAYFDEGKWVIFPSYHDAINSTLTGKTNHFSLFGVISRLGNKAPTIIIHKEPSVYSPTHISVEDLQTGYVEDLKVDIYVDDPENDKVKVFISFGIETTINLAIEMMNTYKDQLTKAMVFQACSDSIEATCKLAKNVGEILDHEIANNIYITPWYELRESSKGHYQSLWKVSDAIDNDLGHTALEIMNIRVFVYIEDEVKDAPILKELIIPYSHSYIPEAPILVSPQLGADVICPPEPEFMWTWSYESGDLVESYRFKIVKGDQDPWDFTVWKIDWKCDEKNGCDDYSKKHFIEETWTPEKPLKAGKYSWKMAASNKKNEKKFAKLKTSHSEIRIFTVDPDLEGNQCITKGLSAQNELVFLEDFDNWYSSDTDNWLQKNGLVSDLQYSENCPNGYSWGKVFSQDPPAGTEVEMGTVVSFEFCNVEQTEEPVMTEELMPVVQTEETIITEEIIKTEPPSLDCSWVIDLSGIWIQSEGSPAHWAKYLSFENGEVGVTDSEEQLVIEGVDALFTYPVNFKYYDFKCTGAYEFNIKSIGTFSVFALAPENKLELKHVQGSYFIYNFVPQDRVFR